MLARSHFHHLNVGNLRRAYRFGRDGARLVKKVARGVKRVSEWAQRESTPKKKMAPVKRQYVENENGATDVVAYSTGNASHKKGVASSRKKRVKVSPAFKAKVIAATNSKLVTGYKEDFYYQGVFGSGIDQQAVGWNPALAVANAPSQWSFLPLYFLDAVSCLFHNKLVANSWAFANEMGSYVAALSADNLKFHVADSYEVYHFKNNTNRGLRLKLYECAPKRISLSSPTPAVIGSGTAGGEVDALQNPVTYWFNALGTDSNNGQNLSNVTPAFLNLAPAQSPTFARGYKTGMSEVFLEPGGTYTYKLQGPSNMDIDMEKYYVNGVLQDIQKYARYVMPVVSSELCVDTASGTKNVFGRMPWAQNGNGGFVLGCERKLYTKIKMPEQTGFVESAITVGNTQDLNLRKNCFIATNWGAALAPTGPYSTLERQTEVPAMS